jgi:hypothetical protein
MQTKQINLCSRHVQASFQALSTNCKYFYFSICYMRIFITPKQAAKRKNTKYIEIHQRECVECKQVKLIKARNMCGLVSKR